MEALKCHTTSEFRIKHVQNREDIQLKTFYTPPSFFLEMLSQFSGSIVSCELDWITQAGKKFSNK